MQHDVQSARDSLERQTNQLRQTADANRGEVAQWWSDVQKSWDEQIASIRRDVEQRLAQPAIRQLRLRMGRDGTRRSPDSSSGESGPAVTRRASQLVKRPWADEWVWGWIRANEERRPSFLEERQAVNWMRDWLSRRRVFA